MKIALEIAGILLIAGAWAFMVWRQRPRRDVCQPLTNQERLLHYIERRAAWEGEQRKRKLLQRQRVERMLEHRYLRHAPHGESRSPITVPQSRVAA